MAQIPVRGLEESAKDALQRRARRNGRGMEEEVRDILRVVVRQDAAPRLGLGTRIARHFAEVGLDEPLATLPRQEAKPANFE